MALTSKSSGFVSRLRTNMYLSFDMFCPVSINQCVSGLLKMDGGRTNVGNHDRLTVSSERFLEQAC